MNITEVNELIRNIEATSTKEKVLKALHELSRLRNAVDNLNVPKLRELLQIPAWVYCPSEIVPRVERLLEIYHAGKNEIRTLQETVFALKQKESELRAQFQTYSDRVEKELVLLGTERNNLKKDLEAAVEENVNLTLELFESTPPSTGTPVVTPRTYPSTFAAAIGHEIRYYNFPTEDCIGHAAWNGEVGRQFTPAEAALRAAEYNTAAGWLGSHVTLQGRTIEVAVTAHE